MGMRLNQIKIQNFGPYYGEQVLRFGVSRPIVLVHGQNMRGKTSFLNAVRWALYGHALDRFKRRMPLKNLINKDAVDSGGWAMSVELEFEVDGSSYVLMRQVQNKDRSMTPRDDRDFQEHLFLRRDTHIINTSEAQVAINRLLPEKISRFFLFDGELLNEYETLLADFDQQAQVVKESIESILGVPALQNAISDLQQNLKDAARRQRVLAKDDRAAHMFATKATHLETEIEAAERDVEHLKEQRDELSRQVSELDEILGRTAGIEVEMERLRDLKIGIDGLHSQEKRLLEDKRQNLTNAWRDLLQPAIRQRTGEIERERDEQLAIFQRVAVLREKLQNLKRLGEVNRCPTCDQPFTHAPPENLRNEEKKIEDELSQLAFDEERMTRLGQSLSKLRKVVGSGAIRTVKHIEVQLMDIRIRVSDEELRRAEVEDRLEGHNETAVARNRRDHKAYTQELGVLDHSIKEKEESIKRWESEAARYRAQISKVSGPQMERLNREVQAYEDLIDIFHKAVIRLRDELRKFVERDASEIFREISTDKSYSGLRINDYYGLTILDADGEEVQVRSAGAEQVVALSLIGALNRNAVRRGPIIMDTPFGRLDPSHRENILRFLPTLADQVTLLVHGGEVDRERDLDHVQDRIDKEYEIGYVSSRRSELVPLKG